MVYQPEGASEPIQLGIVEGLYEACMDEAQAAMVNHQFKAGAFDKEASGFFGKYGLIPVDPCQVKKRDN